MQIKIVSKVSELQEFLNNQKNKMIGFVPTMGALHNGHVSLIKKSNENCDITVCSIFVNPTQFDNKTDLEKYPITIDDDAKLLEANNCDVVFIPNVDEIYPNGTEITETYDFGFVTTICEGAYRTGHFEGVAQVVGRLLDIVNPHKIFMGQKDYQQANIITQLAALKKCRTEVVVCDIIRDEDGLAKSSRNRRLKTEERKVSTVLFEAQNFIKNNIHFYDLEDLMNIAKKMLNDKKHCKLEYIELRDATTLKEITTIEKDLKLVVLTACYVGEVRLIDNLVFES